MSQEEFRVFGRHFGTPDALQIYLDVRNRILQAFYQSPTRSVSLDDALRAARTPRTDLATAVYQFLVRHGAINFGLVRPLPPTPVAVSAPATSARQRTFVVIGAGMAGLACARQLQHVFSAASVPPPKVIVLEARNRVGGRMYTHPLYTKTRSETHGTVHATGVDLGAKIVTGWEGGNPIKTIVKHQLNLTAYDVTRATRLYDADGAPVPDERDMLCETVFNEILEETVRMRASAEGQGEGLHDVEMGEAGDEEDDDAESEDEFVPTTHLSKTMASQSSSFQRRSTRRAARAAGRQSSGSAMARPHSLGEALERALEQHPRYQDLTDADLRLIHWHIANLEFANATTIDQLSLEHWDQDDEHEFFGPHSMVVGGYGQVPYALAYGAPSSSSSSSASGDAESLVKDKLDVRLNAPVATVEWKRTTRGNLRNGSDAGPNVIVRCRDGTEIDADATIIAVPLGVLKAQAIKFEPELPKAKTEAIARLGFGVLNKVVLVFQEPFWDLAADSFGFLSPMDPATQSAHNRNPWSPVSSHLPRGRGRGRDRGRGFAFESRGAFESPSSPFLTAAAREVPRDDIFWTSPAFPGSLSGLIIGKKAVTINALKKEFPALSLDLHPAGQPGRRLSYHRSTSESLDSDVPPPMAEMSVSGQYGWRGTPQERARQLQDFKDRFLAFLPAASLSRPMRTLLCHVQGDDLLKWCSFDASGFSVLPLHQTVESPPPYFILARTGPGSTACGGQDVALPGFCNSIESKNHVLRRMVHDAVVSLDLRAAGYGAMAPHDDDDMSPIKLKGRFGAALFAESRMYRSSELTTVEYPWAVQPTKCHFLARTVARALGDRTVCMSLHTALPSAIREPFLEWLIHEQQYRVVARGTKVTANWQADFSTQPLMPRTRYRAAFALETVENQHLDSVMQSLDLLMGNSMATGSTTAMYKPHFTLKGLDQTSIPLTKCTFVAPDASIAPRLTQVIRHPYKDRVDDDQYDHARSLLDALNERVDELLPDPDHLELGLFHDRDEVEPFFATPLGMCELLVRHNTYIKLQSPDNKFMVKVGLFTNLPCTGKLLPNHGPEADAVPGTSIIVTSKHLQYPRELVEAHRNRGVVPPGVQQPLSSRNEELLVGMARQFDAMQNRVADQLTQLVEDLAASRLNAE